MSLRYLFGPVDGQFADQHLSEARREGGCKTFGSDEFADIQILPGESWDNLIARLPKDWQPDFVALWLAYTVVPSCVWSAHIPIVGLAADWNLLWHYYRSVIGHCERVLTDSGGVEAMRRAGSDHVRSCNLFGLGRDFLVKDAAELVRDIDIAFVGNVQPAVQHERAPWLARLTRLEGQRNVVIRSGVFGEEYRTLLRRARIVFNRSIRGECNRRTFEAAACGALLFQEAENREVSQVFADRRECVYYSEKNFEELLAYYLDHEDERRTIAAAGRLRAREFAFSRIWSEAVSAIESDWDSLLHQSHRRIQPSERSLLFSRTLCACTAGLSQEPTLFRDLGAAVVDAPHDAYMHYALGVASGLDPVRTGVESAIASFRKALACAPGHPLAGLGLTESLVTAGQNAAAIAQAQSSLKVLNEPKPWSNEILDSAFCSSGFDRFRVAWERIGWQHGDCPTLEEQLKRTLVRGQLHSVLADLTGDLTHFYEAALATPHQPVARAALGCALARSGKFTEAQPHLQAAVAGDPFDLPASRALFQLYGNHADWLSQRRLARDLRNLHRAAPHVVRKEEWFADVPPPGDELTSVLIVCCNELASTRACIASVLANTRTPFELILVDNGSTDGTAEFLDDLRRAQHVAQCVEVIHNAENRGYPAAMNQALGRATGEYLVMLNNDTIVPPRWLDGLIVWSLFDWPRVGVVGPMSNYAPPPQFVRAPYSDPGEGLNEFAHDWSLRNAGKGFDVPRLSGFCMLVRRDVRDRVGGLDERFGIGFFDDDDFVLRVRAAGFRAIVAEDVFVHHHGSRTFRALGIDTERLLETNLDEFRSKWGAERAAGYRPMANPERIATTNTVVRPNRVAADSPSTRVSLCVIVRNEEVNLADCLRDWQELFSEAIVVDTGSTDRTRDIARTLGAQVFEFPWCDSFAAARNASLEHATGEWVFWLDADDRLDVTNHVKLRELIGSLRDENVAYSLKCVCVPDTPGGSATVVDHIRLFRNDPRLRWKYRVHEQILPAIRAIGGEVRWANVSIQHVGYQDPALRRRKLDRDLRLLDLEHHDHPDDPFTLFNLGSVYLEMGRPGEALPLLRRSLERSHPSDSIVRKLYALTAGAHRQLDESPAALEVCRDGLQHYPNDAELLFLEGAIHREAGRANDAEACWIRVLDSHEGEHFASIDNGLRGYKTRHNLAALFLEKHRIAEAEAQWRTALSQEPAFLPAWLGLGELYLKSHRWPEFDEVLRQLEGDGVGAPPLESAVLRARGYLERKEFGAARWSITEAIENSPTALLPRVILSHVLLQEGRDTAAAELALLDVLEMDPNHREAKHNLDVLRGPQTATV